MQTAGDLLCSFKTRPNLSKATSEGHRGDNVWPKLGWIWGLWLGWCPCSELPVLRWGVGWWGGETTNGSGRMSAHQLRTGHVPPPLPVPEALEILSLYFRPEIRHGKIHGFQILLQINPFSRQKVLKWVQCRGVARISAGESRVAALTAPGSSHGQVAHFNGSLMYLATLLGVQGTLVSPAAHFWGAQSQRCWGCYSIG